MKKIIFVALLAIMAGSAFSQIKISQLPTLTDPAGGVVPVSVGGTTYKVPAENLGKPADSLINGTGTNISNPSDHVYSVDIDETWLYNYMQGNQFVTMSPGLGAYVDNLNTNEFTIGIDTSWLSSFITPYIPPGGGASTLQNSWLADSSAAPTLNIRSNTFTIQGDNGNFTTGGMVPAWSSIVGSATKTMSLDTDEFNFSTANNNGSASLRLGALRAIYTDYSDSNKTRFGIGTYYPGFGLDVAQRSRFRRRMMLPGGSILDGYSSGASFDSTGGGVGIAGGISQTDAGYIFGVGNGTSRLYTSGIGGAINIFGTFAPQSGTARHNGIAIQTTVNNQSNGSQIISGLYVNPGLFNSTADYRAIEVVTGSIVLPYRARTSAYTITQNDYLINATTGTYTVTAPTSVGMTGKNFVVKNSGSGTITLAATGGELFDGAATVTLTQNKYVHIVSTGSGWIIIADNL